VSARPRPDAAHPDPAGRVIFRLCRELAATRLRYANLLAAARATLSAARDGELDALEYLADELTAQHGQHDLNPGWWDEVGR
jgi:hypothetical protein